MLRSRGGDSHVVHNISGQVFSLTDGVIADLPNQVTLVIRSTIHLLLGLYCHTHSRKSILLTRKGCSKTKLLFADVWWYYKAPVSVLRQMKPKVKLTLNTVIWSGKMRLNCFRKLAGLMVESQIIPVLKLVTAPEPGSDLGPVLTVHLGDIFVSGNKVRGDKDRLCFPV